MAVAGARQQVRALQAEIDLLVGLFPELATQPWSEPTAASGNGHAPPVAAQPVKKRSMTKAQRAAVGERMKKYWRARRKAKKAEVRA